MITTREQLDALQAGEMLSAVNKETTRNKFTLDPHPQYQDLVNWLETMPSGAVVREARMNRVFVKRGTTWRTIGDNDFFASSQVAEDVLYCANDDDKPMHLEVLYDGDEEN